MVNKKSRPSVQPEEDVKRIGSKLYAIHGQFNKSEVLDLSGEQVSIDTSGLVTISGNNIEQLFYSTDNYITFLDQNAVLLITDQTVTGTKTWLDNQLFTSNILPTGATQAVGSLGAPFNEVHANTVYADLISSGSPGIKITHGAGAGLIDSTENNDLHFKRFGVPFMKLLESGVSLEQDVVILGNLTVQGTRTELNTEELLIEDNTFILNHNFTGLPLLDAGFIVNRGSETASLLLWDEQQDKFIAGISGSAEPIILHSDLIAASGVLQSDINTRATFAQLLSTSGILQTDINTRATYAQLVSASGILQTDINSRVLKTGDTMTGTLVVPTVQGSGDLLLDAVGNDLYLRAQDDIFVDPGNAGIRWIFDNSGNFYPNVDGSYNIGTSSRALDTTFSRNLLSDTNLGLGVSNVVRWTIDTSANLFPDTNGSRNLGDTTHHVGSVFTRTVSSQGANLNLTSNASVGVTATSDFTAAVQGNISMYLNDSDGSDNGFIHIGTSSAPNYGRGAFLELYGNENAGNGDVRLGCGDGSILLYAGSVASTNAVRWQISNTGRLSSNNTDLSQEYFNITATAAGYNSRIAQLIASRGASGLFYNLATGASNGSNLLHILSGDGNIFIDGSFIDTGADYAEYFEFLNGTAIPRGETVVLDGDKIRAYSSETDSPSDIIGVVRPDGTASSTNHPINWPGKYEKDEFGDFILDENGDRVESSEYDSEQEYVWRSKRPEWAPVGLVGQVQVLKSATKHPNWKKMRDISQLVELWFIR